MFCNNTKSLANKTTKLRQWVSLTYLGKTTVRTYTITARGPSINPNKCKSWKIETENGTTENESDVADAFNSFFIGKIQKLKEGINQEDNTNPLEKLAKKMETRNLKFSLKNHIQKLSFMTCVLCHYHQLFIEIQKENTSCIVCFHV